MLAEFRLGCKTATLKMESEMEDNIKIDVREISCEEGKEMEVAQDHF
jgi:hypothetical protein